MPTTDWAQCSEAEYQGAWDVGPTGGRRLTMTQYEVVPGRGVFVAWCPHGVAQPIILRESWQDEDGRWHHTFYQRVLA